MAPRFNKRSDKEELIDSAFVSKAEALQNFKELNIFNRVTGSNSVTIKEIGKYLQSNKIVNPHIVDIGCGGGEFLFNLATWCEKYKIKCSLTGIDNSPIAIEYLNTRTGKSKNIRAYLNDYKVFLSDNRSKIDVLHCSLFCHHLKEDEIILIIQKSLEGKSLLIINDLKRSRVAWVGSILLTRLFNGTRLAKNDGPLSVLKGFKRWELINLIKRAGAVNYTIKSIPFFRFLITIYPNE